MHIRRGDKYVESATVGLDVYKQVLRDAIDAHSPAGIAGLIISSDNAEAVRQMSLVANHLNTSVLNAAEAAQEMRHYGPNSKAALDTHALDITTYALTAILTVEILALGNIFVGQFSSNVLRLAYELAVAEGRVVDAACSLDVLWHASP